MGATPMAAFILLSLTAALLAQRAGQPWITRSFNGLRSLADLHAVPLAGGDTSESPTNTILADIVLVGTALKGKALRRSGARVGNSLYVTGHLGGAATELSAILKRGKRITRITAMDTHPHLFPEPRIDAAQAHPRLQLPPACTPLP